MREIDELGKLMLKLKKGNKDNDKIISKLKDQNRLLAKKYDLMNKNITYVSQSYEKVGEKIFKIVDDKTNSLLVEMGHLNSKFVHYDESMDEYEHRLLSLRKDYERSIEALKTLKKDVKSLDKSNLNLRENILETDSKIPIHDISKLIEKSKQADLHLKRLESGMSRLQKTMEDNIFEKDIGEEIELSFEKIQSIRDEQNEVKKFLDGLSKAFEANIRDQDKFVDRYNKNLKKIDKKLKRNELISKNEVEKIRKKTISEMKTFNDRLIDGLKVISNFKSDLKRLCDTDTNVSRKMNEIENFMDIISSKLKNQKQEIQTEFITNINGLRVEITGINDQLSTEVTLFRDKISAFEGQFGSLEAEIQSINSKDQNIETKMGDFNLQIQNLESKIQSIDEKNNELVSRADEINVIKDELNSLNLVRENILNLNGNYENLEKRINDMVENQRVETSQIFDEKIDEKLNSYGAKVNQLEGELTQLRDDFNKIESSITKIPDHFGDLELIDSEINGIKDSYDKMVIENKGHILRIDQLEDNFNGLSKNLTEVKSSLGETHNFSKNIDLIHKEIIDMKSQNEILLMDFEKWKSQSEKIFTNEKKGLTKKFNEFSENKQKFIDEIDDFRNRLIQDMEQSESRIHNNFENFVDKIKARQKKNERRLNEITVDLLKQKSVLNSNIENLDSSTRRFIKFEKNFKNDIFDEVFKMFDESRKDHNKTEQKLTLLGQNLTNLNLNFEKLSRKVNNITKDLELTKERYKIELGLLLKEVEQ